MKYGSNVVHDVDLTKLCIVSDLRKIGFNTKKIKTIFNRISAGFVLLADMKTNKGKPFKFLELEHAIMYCASGRKMFLLVRKDEQVYFKDKTMLYHLQVENDSFPIIIMPFFSYIQKIFRLMKKEIDTSKKSTMEQFFDAMPSEKEEKILEVIRNKAFQKIKIVKSDNEQFIIYETSYKKGVFSNKDIIEAINKGLYQNITVFTKDGKKIGLRKEKKIRI